jgi:hypothetical protein
MEMTMKKDEHERWRCGRCLMSFRVQEKPARASGGHCPEANCRLKFWHGVLKPGEGVAIGIHPQEVAA